MANPCCLADLEASDDRPVWVSGRDGRAWFDQLRLPPGLARTMGMPEISVEELLMSDDICIPLTMEEVLGAYLDDGGIVHGATGAPVLLVWPIGPHTWRNHPC